MTASEFQDLIQNCQPHQVFNLDWKSYYSLDFAETFLPNTAEYRGRAFHFFDGAELLLNTKNVIHNELKLDKNKNLTSVVFYSYPKGVEAEKKKNRIQTEDFAILAFIEVHQNEKIDVSFKFGSEFTDFLKAYVKENNLSESTVSVQNKIYSSSISAFRNHFVDEISHYNMLSFIGEIIGIDLISVHNKNTLSLKFNSIKAVTSEPSKDLKQIKKQKKEKYITIDFEILNQPVINYVFFVYDGTTEIESLTYLPEIVVKPNWEAETTTKPSLFESGKYQIIWDCTNNGIFDTKDTNKKLHIQITARTETGLTSVLKISFNIKQLIDDSVTNNYILIIDSDKTEEDEDYYIKIYANEIINRQRLIRRRIENSEYEKLSKKEQLILDLPIILTKLNWLYSAYCQLYWLEGTGEDLIFPHEFPENYERTQEALKDMKYDFTQIQYASYKDETNYYPHLSFNDGGNQFLYNFNIPSAIQAYDKATEFLHEIEDYYEHDFGDFDMSELPPKMNFVKSYTIGSMWGDMDDLGGSFGRLSLRVYVGGLVERKDFVAETLNLYYLNIMEVGYRYFDEFSFNGNQDLGVWKYDLNNPEPPERFVLFGSDWYSLSNEVYRKLSNRTNIGIKPKNFNLLTPIVVLDAEKNMTIPKNIPFYLKK